MVESDELKSGDVGYVVVLEIWHTFNQETQVSKQEPCIEPLSGYKNKTNGVSGLYPNDGDEYDQLRVALEKLKLNDASVEFIPETSEALGLDLDVGF